MKSKDMKKRKLEDMDSDAFMKQGLESDSSDDASSDDVNDETDDEQITSASDHKKTLSKLQSQDPEFYQFLQKEDQDLLNFDDSDDDSDDGEGHIHQLPDKLEVASDEEMDSEDLSSNEEEKKKKKKAKEKKKTLITMKMLTLWTKSLKEEKSVGSLRHIISALKAAVNQAGGESADSNYKVEGSAVFNAIVRVCITDLLPTTLSILKLPKSKDPNKPVLPSSSKQWKQIRVDMKSYLTDVLKLLGEVAEGAIVNVLLKHIHTMLLFYTCFPQLSKLLLKKLIELWSTAEETTRVLAFLSINRLVCLIKDKMLDFSIKKMYMAFVKNSMFTSPTTLPMINFMQRSLVEMLTIDMEMTYEYAFVYIRQLAIHLRNAITVKKKDNYRTVYNWQFVHSMHLWARLISIVYPNSTLEPLIYPLTQIVIGAIKLIPSPRYYPLRFHCIKTLNLLSKHTNTFIPVLPFLTEVFDLTDFNKHHSGINIKPFNFSCILKLSKTQLHERGFRDGVIDQLYELFLENFNIHAHTIGFPEMALPTLLQMRRFLKQCKVANYTKQIKQIVDKVTETSTTITKRRKVSTLNLADRNGVDAWEARSKSEGTPLSKYYATWRVLRDRELQYDIAGKEKLMKSEQLPTIERKNVPKKADESDRKEFSALFDSNSEDEEDDDDRFCPDKKRARKKQKISNEDDSDDYSDLDEDELNQLAGSASEDESEADENDSEAEGEDDDDDEEDSGEDEEEEDSGDDEEEEHNEKEQKKRSLAKDIVKDFEFSSDEEM